MKVLDCELKQSCTEGEKERASGNFRVLDMAAGPGTTVNTIFVLKEEGILRGSKRRLRFSEDDRSNMVSKCKKMEVDQIGGGSTSNSKDQMGGGLLTQTNGTDLS